MPTITELRDGVYELTMPLRLGVGFELPARTTLLRSASGGLIVVSPIAFDDGTQRAIDALGSVEHIVAPNRLHHFYVADASRRWPHAKVHGVGGLAQKRPDVHFDAELGSDPRSLGASVEQLPIEGMPALSEVALLHRPSRTLVVTDLVFNVTRPRGLMTGLILRLVGAHRRFAQSRAVRWMAKDKVAYAKSAAHLLDHDFDAVVMAHGDPVLEGGKDKLRSALFGALDGAQHPLAGGTKTPPLLG